MARESTELALIRWGQVEVLQKHYASFIDFLRDGMEYLGFSTTDIQEDIASYIAHGPQFLMVQAQRGEAKTTIAALYAVWSVLMLPKLRVLIVSAGGTQATEISTLIVRIITTWDVLECLAPDKTAGDRTSVEAFDVHHSLKGVDKSPTVACVGITANLQGKRADLLIPDDIESAKNAATALQREQLSHLTKDFSSICVGTEGYAPRIVWLGTPQTSDSIYNALPGRGVSVRIWPGRYPTQDEIQHYGPYLAPLIERRIAMRPDLQAGGGFLGDKGQPTDPVLYDESKLQHKEQDQGPAYFQLQHMLNTKLTDAMRHPLKTERLVAIRLTDTRLVPAVIRPGLLKEHLIPVNLGGTALHVCQPSHISPESVLVPALVMYIDPAGGGKNADETGYAVTGMMNGTIFLFDVGGVPGGYELDKLNKLADVAKKWSVNTVVIEKNMGFGAFKEVFQPVLRSRHPCEVKDDYVTGQKELRIIATLEPIMGRGSLVINSDLLELDYERAKHYGVHALTYCFLFQLMKLTRDRDSLLHDDRLDSVEGACRFFQALLAQDQERLLEQARQQAWREQIKDPMGYNRYKRPGPLGRSILSKRFR